MDNNGITLSSYKTLSRSESKATSIGNLYNMWRDFFYTRILRIFEWNGLPFPQRELESALVLNGINYVAYHDDEFGFVTNNGSIYGVTRYNDVYTNVVYSMPSEKKGRSISGTRELGVDAVACYNTSTMMSMYPFICRHASLKTHADLTLKCALINLREQEILVAGNDSAKESVAEYYASKYNGKPKAIIDDSLTVNVGGMDNLAKNTNRTSLTEIMDAGNEILREFYREIGIRWTKEKRANMISDEVDSDEQMLLFNVSDMLHCREEFCRDFNALFSSKLGHEISVKLSPEFSVLSDIEMEVKEDERQED